MLLVAVVVSAQPVQWPVADGGNGHWYEYVAAPGIDWEAAFLAAQVFNSGIGAWGFLMAIESAEENAWVLANVATTQNAWIALRQETGCEFEPDLGWSWATVPVVPPLPYTNWCSGEPDDGGTTECFLVPHQQYGMFATGGCWTDEFADYPVTGYLVEYEWIPLPVEPTTWGGVKALYK